MADIQEHEDKGGELTTYELGYHFVPSLGEQDLALRVETLHKAIAEAGGTIISEGHPQSFVLAYTMRKLRSGKWENYDSTFFGWIRFSASSTGIPTLHEELNHMDFIVRYLCIKITEDALAAPAPVIRKNEVAVSEVTVEPKALVRRVDEEEKTEVSEEELDKQIEQLIS